MFFYLWILFTVVSAEQPCFRHLNNTPQLLGTYRPQCTELGMYHAKQCHGSTGYCWCVSPHGNRRLAPVPPGASLSC